MLVAAVARRDGAKGAGHGRDGTGARGQVPPARAQRARIPRL